MTIVFAFFLGAIVGSTPSVCIHRIPYGESVVVPASHYPTCQTPIQAWNNIPFISLALLAFRALGAGLAIAWRYTRPLFPWAAWGPIMLLPPPLFVLDSRAIEGGLFPAELFLCLPSLGWCVLLGSAVSMLLERRDQSNGNGWGLVTLGGYILGYAALTWIRLMPRSDASDLYVAMKGQANPPAHVCVLVHNNLGKVYLQRGEFPTARAEPSAALRLKRDYPLAHNNAVDAINEVHSPCAKDETMRERKGGNDTARGGTAGRGR